MQEIIKSIKNMSKDDILNADIPNEYKAIFLSLNNFEPNELLLGIQSCFSYLKSFENCEWYEEIKGTLKFRPALLAKYLKEKKNIILYKHSFYFYTNGYYKHLENQYLKKIIKEYQTPNLITAKSINDTFDILKSEAFIEDEELHTDLSKLVLKNGVFDIYEKELKEHTPDIKSLNKFNVEYNKDSDCIEFKKALWNLLEPDQVILLQEIFGYSLCPLGNAEKFFLLVGGGGNGKSTALQPLQEILGVENYSSLTLQDLHHEFKLSKALGKRANICTDNSTDELKDLSVLKKAVSGEPITINIKNKEPLTAKLKLSAIFSMNKIPRFPEHSNAIDRRIIIIPFNKKIENPDRTLINRIIENELSGIFNWALEGLYRLVENNFEFSIGQANKKALNKVKEAQNPLLSFIEEYTEKGKDYRMNTSITYKKYKEWAKENGFRQQNRNTFYANFENLGFDRKKDTKTGKTYFLDIAFKEDVAIITNSLELINAN